MDTSQMARCRHGLPAITCAYCRSSDGINSRSTSRLVRAGVRQDFAHPAHADVSPANSRDRATQLFPRTGSLVTNLNLGLPALSNVLRGQGGPVYCYVETSIHYEGE